MSTSMRVPSSVDTQPLRRLSDVLALEQLEPTLFRSRQHDGASIRIFGGEVAAQAVTAAAATVDADRHIHSAHTYYLLPGDTSQPVVYRVAVERDGGSFSNRSVTALQDGRVIFTMSASFQVVRSGLQHQVPTLEAPPPDTLPAPSVTFADDPGTTSWLEGLMQRIPVELRFPETIHAGDVRGGKPAIRTWMRSAERLADHRLIQSAGLVYLSDLFMLSTALRAHGHRIDDPAVQFATVDHSVWFHAPCRADDWFMYEIESDWTGHGRALCRGRIFDQAGRLCASTVQEGTFRVLQ
ncbi:MAG: acyl-CoA thioesterase domain-containing protein [Aeromicrobium sp.]